MLDKNKINYIDQYSILEREEENLKIVIWPDAPYWIMVEEETAKLIGYINGHTFGEIIHLIEKSLKKKIEELDVMELLEHLKMVNVLYQEGELHEEEKRYYSIVIRYLTLNITDTCNLFCRHCYIDASSKNQKFLNLESVKLIIGKLKKMMVNSCNINVSGGEALMNPECISILKYLKQEGFKSLNIVSNGTLIDDNIANQLKEIENLSVQISLDGASKEVHERIRGKNTYDRTINGIRKCVERGIQVALSPIVTEELYGELEEYFLLARELGVRSVFLQPINEVGRAKENGLKRVEEEKVFKKFVEIYKKYDDLDRYIPGSLDVQHFTSIKMLEKCLFCGSGISSLAVQPDGTCYPCPNTIIEELKICNILTDDIETLWFESPVLEKMRGISVNKNLPSKCAECEVKLFCGGGCRGVAIKSTGNLYGMSPECESSKNRLIEMIWTAAKEPDLFNYEIERNQKMDEVLENEIEKITEGNFKFTKIIQE